MALVFEAANGANLDTIRVPGFFTYDGLLRPGCSRICRRSATSCEKDNWVLGASGDQNAVQQQFASLYPRHSRALRQGFHRRLDRRDQQPSTEAAAQRQAEISEAERRLGADLAHSSDLRIHSRRDGLDPRASEAAGAERLRRCDQGEGGGAGRGGQPTGQRRKGGPRPCDEVAAQGGRSAARDARRLDRGLFQADPDPGRRAARIAADRPICSPT